MKLEAITKCIEAFAPLETQAEWDNSGVQIFTGKTEIKSVLVALDVTRDVVNEAIEKDIDLIVTHHPLMFRPVKSIKLTDKPQEYIINLIKNDTNVYSSHTPFDVAKKGNNYYFLEKLGLKDIKSVDEYVRIGRFERAVKLSDLAKKIAKVSKQEGLVKVQGNPDAKIKTVGICTGSGGDLFEVAKANGADAYISGDIKHSDALKAKDCGICLIDAGHFGTENCFIDNMYDYLSAKLGKKVKLYKTETNQNPFDFSI